MEVLDLVVDSFKIVYHDTDAAFVTFGRTDIILGYWLGWKTLRIQWTDLTKRTGGTHESELP